VAALQDQHSSTRTNVGVASVKLRAAPHALGSDPPLYGDARIFADFIGRCGIYDGHLRNLTGDNTDEKP
jgi:hypothetical protein